MKNKIILISTWLFVTASYFLISCNSDTDHTTIAKDSLSIAHGQSLFMQHCSGCHNFKQDGIGPDLSGLTDSVDLKWIQKFIKNPKQLIDSGDKRAEKLFKKYQTVMPSFLAIKENELNNIIAFMHTKKKTVKKRQVSDPNALKNPVPAKIEVSDVVVALDLVTQIPSSNKEPPLARIVKMDIEPHTGSLFILDLRGKLFKLEKDLPSIYFDMATYKSDFIHQPGLGSGFGSFAFHPSFANNGLLYTTHTERANSKQADFAFDDSIKVTLQWVITEWKTQQPDAFPFSGTGRELFRVNMVAGLHGVQDISFNPIAKPGSEDYGLLYIGIGDGGAVENGHADLVHSVDRIWGTILRIDPAGRNSVNRQYGIPPQNPFSQRGISALGEIYAYGFRNPNRLTWLKSGGMLATNIGHAHIESVNIIRKGHNYGWPIREGTFALHPGKDLNNIYLLPSDDSVFNITYPVIQYDHDEGKAIAGGYEYTGTAVSTLRGKYLFGDIVNGRLFYSETAHMKQGRQSPVKEWQITMNGKRASLRDICGNKRVDLRFGRDKKGEMYVFTKADGKVYRLRR